MDEMIYLAMTGARQTEYAQTINSNNLANDINKKKGEMFISPSFSLFNLIFTLL